MHNSFYEHGRVLPINSRLSDYNIPNSENPSVLNSKPTLSFSEKQSTRPAPLEDPLRLKPGHQGYQRRVNFLQ